MVTYILDSTTDSTITLDEMNYKMDDLASAARDKFKVWEPNIKCIISAVADHFEKLIQVVDHRPSTPDVATINIVDDVDLEQGVHTSAVRLSPQAINTILQNYNTGTTNR